MMVTTREDLGPDKNVADDALIRRIRAGFPRHVVSVGPGGKRGAEPTLDLLEQIVPSASSGWPPNWRKTLNVGRTPRPIWRPGKKVLFSPQWIERVSWDERKAFVNLSRAAIKESPEYLETAPLARLYHP